MKQTPREKINARLEAALEINAALLIASQKHFGFDRRELLGLYHRIKACNDRSNIFIVPEAYSHETGEVFEATGSLWSCNSKLCPQCLAKQAARSRKKLREAMQRQTLYQGERYYFATFTIRNPKASLLETRDIVNRAWSLFRKRKLCVDLIRGGVKSEEFTLTANGFHYHLHCIFLSRFILYNEARRVWTECVDQAFAESNRTLEVKTKDAMLIVKFQPITATERAIHEVCKYVTKSDSWYKMKPEDLASLALVRRWHRMFELLGSFAQPKAMNISDENASNEAPSIVHTRNLTDGEKPSHSTYWRDIIEEHGLEKYLEILSDEIARTYTARIEQLKRRWPGETIIIAKDLTDAQTSGNAA